MPRMNRTIALAVLLVACGKDKAKDKEPPPEPAKVVEPAKPEPPKQAETTAAVFGKTVGPFGKVAKLKLGMTEADAKAAAPELFGASGPQKVSSPEEALDYTLVIEFGRLVRIDIESTSLENLEKLVAEAWGPGTQGKTISGGDQVFWFSPATHTRARADSSDLELAEYLPLEELLGPDKATIAALPKPVVGASLEDLQRDYGAQMKPDEKLKHIYLPPAEWDREHVSVFVLYSERKKKVTNYQFRIDDEGHPPAKEASLAVFKKKWGEPKLLKSYGSERETMVFHSKNPLIEIDREVDNKAWQVRVRAKDDACGGPCYKGL